MSGAAIATTGLSRFPLAVLRALRDLDRFTPGAGFTRAQVSRRGCVIDDKWSWWLDLVRDGYVTKTGDPYVLGQHTDHFRLTDYGREALAAHEEASR